MEDKIGKGGRNIHGCCYGDLADLLQDICNIIITATLDKNIIMNLIKIMVIKWVSRWHYPVIKQIVQIFHKAHFFVSAHFIVHSILFDLDVWMWIYKSVNIKSRVNLFHSPGVQPGFRERVNIGLNIKPLMLLLLLKPSPPSLHSIKRSPRILAFSILHIAYSEYCILRIA